MDTVLFDLSDHNKMVNDSVITDWRKWSHWLCFRSNDGNYSDQHWSGNAAWSEKNDKEIIGIINYLVYPPSENDATMNETVALFLSRLSSRDRKYLRKLVAMIDVENWGGRWKKDFSRDLNEAYSALVKGLHSFRPKWQQKIIGIRHYCLRQDHKRVIGYGNAGDLNLMWPRKPKGMRIILANYASNTRYPGEVIHQYSSHYNVPGLGFVDINSADGYSPRKLARKLGLTWLVRKVF